MRGRPRGSREKTLSQLYQENKKVLNEAGYDYQMFEANMKNIMRENNKRTPGAWKIFKHKTDFTSKERIGAENLVQGIKNTSSEAYKDFRKEVVGWKEKVDYDKFTYDDETSKYTYENANGDIFVFTLVTGPYGSQYWSWERV